MSKTPKLAAGLLFMALVGGSASKSAMAQAPAELLSAPGFTPLPEPQKTDGPWLPFEGGYAAVAGGGPEGKNSVSMTRRGDSPAMGIKQNLVLNQKQAAPLRVSGWSRAANVSGVPDGDYSLYCDITFADGTNSWGECAPFRTGTHDWDLVDFSLTPGKPIQSLTVYGLFRVHTGQAWFSGFSVKGQKTVIAAAKPVTGLKPVKVAAVKSDERRQYVAAIPSSGAVMRVTPPSIRNLFQNPAMSGMPEQVPVNWIGWGGGVALADKDGGQAEVTARRVAGDPEKGFMQELVLNQKAPQTLYFTGWSKPENVSGTPDSDYALYADITYMDGSQAWGENAPFRTGTVGWNKAELVLVPPKPIQSIRAYALFRNHTGQAKFRNLSIGPREPAPGTADFDGLAVKTQGVKETAELLKPAVFHSATKDGLDLDLERKSGRVASLKVGGNESAAKGVPSGFLARDVANGSDFLPFTAAGSQALKLRLDFQVQAGAESIGISGKVADTSGADRAVSLVFALPIEGAGWSWEQDIRAAKPIAVGTEYSNTVGIGSGANGRISIYPLAVLQKAAAGSGLALFVDPNYAAQYRLAYNSATKQLYVVFDFGLTPEKPSAPFKFGLMRTDKWGFRSALDKLYRAYPAAFEARGEAKKQGLWMPFTDLRKVNGWQDFGFRFREAEIGARDDGSSAFDRANGIVSLRYCEPSTWWMNMSKDTPRTYEAALAQLEQTASDPGHERYREAKAVISSGFRDDSGRLAVRFIDAPWAAGAVWSLNPSPTLPGDIIEAMIKGPIFTGKDKVFHGQYLDSVEGYVTSDLDFDASHFKASDANLTFAAGTFRPALHKAMSMWSFSKWSRSKLEQDGGLLMANSVPHRFGFLMPQMDIAGTETNWNSDGTYRPDSDAAMNLRRIWSGRKPYLLLQNTDFRRFDGDMMKRYMERCLFYGIFPSCFSADAATDPYWLNPKLYDRDRPTFKKYVPLVKMVAEAGWQPVTWATSSDPSIWIERWGAPGKGPVYWTVRNDSATAKTATVKLVPGGPGVVKSAREEVSGKSLTVKDGVITVALGADETVVLKIGG